MEIIYPMFLLVVLTFVVGFSNGILRLVSVKRGHVDRRYFRLLTGYNPPEYIIKLGRNFSNLLELPILFYALCIVLLLLDINNTLMLNLAWSFVGFRIIHSFIHITYNNTRHRFLAFLTSSTILLVMWCYLMTII